MQIRSTLTAVKKAREFTDREAPRNLFWEQYEKTKQQRGSVHVLNYYGIGGIGKSRLLRQLAKEMSERMPESIVLYLDFNTRQETLGSLMALRNMLTNLHDYSFNLFDYSYYVYARKIGEDPKKPEVQSIIGSSRTLSKVFEKLGDVPVWGMYAKLVEIADTGIAELRTWLNAHDAEVSQLGLDEPGQIYQSLVQAFIKDIRDNHKDFQEPLVFLLDTYEKLSSANYDVAPDEWLRGENGLIPNLPNVLWVIAGREKLRWGESDPDWNEAIVPVVLGSLSEADRAKFLTSCGIENAELQNAIGRLTGGLPVWLDLCVDRYEALTGKGQTPTTDDFAGTPEKLVLRFVADLDSAQKDIVYMLACIGAWDDEFVAEVGPKVLSGWSPSAYEAVKKLSFIMSEDDGGFYMHNIVADILYGACPASLKANAEARTAEYFDAILKDFDPLSTKCQRALIGFIRINMRSINDAEVFEKFYEEKVNANLKALDEAYQFNAIDRVYYMIDKKARQWPDTKLFARVLMIGAHLKTDKGERDFAKELAQKAVDVCLKLIPPDEELLWSAETELALALNKCGRYREAKDLNQRIYEKRKELLGEVNEDTLSAELNLASALIPLGEYDNASIHALNVYEKRKGLLGENAPATLNAEFSYACKLSYLGNDREALAHHQSVLEKFKELYGDNHPKVLHVEGWYAHSLLALGKYEEALKYHLPLLSKITESTIKSK